MRNIFVISDTHWGHANIIQYSNRPFSSLEEMNEKMIENWNNVVRDQDVVYHLGDVYFSKNHGDFYKRLRGRKRLILGNHDSGKDKLLLDTFQKIVVWRMFPEFRLLLTHVPVHPYAMEDHSTRKFERNIHGHVHLNSLKDDRYINVSCELINYTPVNIEQYRVK